MMKKFYSFLCIMMLATSVSLSSCVKEDDNGSNNQNNDSVNNLIINFEHYVDGKPLLVDTLLYTNAAGNRYLVYEVQYFVTEVTLYKNDGTQRQIKDWQDYFYVDIDEPSTLQWKVYDHINAGHYDSLSFRLGFVAEKNVSFMFVNPPESNMFWPEYLGGGYHYMKLNGKWIDTNRVLRSFDFHLGPGQQYDNQGNPVPPFIDNSIRISLPQSSFAIADGKTTTITIRMNIENWFQNPYVYDHNQWGGAIMQNQAAMAMACQNAKDVFEFVSP